MELPPAILQGLSRLPFHTDKAHIVDGHTRSMLATRAGVLWVACAVLFIYASAPAHAVNCYHGSATPRGIEASVVVLARW